jgi:hypothetical protein
MNTTIFENMIVREPSEFYDKGKGTRSAFFRILSSSRTKMILMKNKLFINIISVYKE